MEEKGGVFHIIFFMLGVVLISLGVFLYLTPEKTNKGLIDEEKDNSNNKTIIDEKNIIKEIDFGDSDVTKIEKLKSGKEIKISVSLKEDNTIILYDDKEVLSLDNELLNKYFIYNDLFIVFSYSLDDFGIIYTINTDKKVTKIEELDMNNRIMKPVSLNIDNDKLIVIGLRLSENVLILDNDEIDICDDEILQNHNIENDTPIKIEYNFNVINQKTVFDFIKVDGTIESAKKIICKDVE